MVKPWILALVAVTCSGCMMTALDRATVAQADTAVDLRYREVLDNLALIANNPANLPSYSSIYSGLSQVTDTGTMVSTTMWQHTKTTPAQNGFASEAANPQLMRQWLQNWSLDPIELPEKLEAFRGSYKWVVYGADSLDARGASLLASPDQDPSPGRHFGVRDRLAALPRGWLHVGGLKEVPAGACFRARCCDTWVWVMPDGMEGLADFTLIMQDIARVSSNSRTLFAELPAPTTMRLGTADPPFRQDPNDPSHGKDVRLSVIVAVDPCGRLTTDAPYFKGRMENVSSDAKFRTEINAAGATR